MARKNNNIYIEGGARLFKSKAYISLTGKSTQVYGILLTKRELSKISIGKRKAWTVKNNGEIQFTYNEANTLGISNIQFNHALEQLTNRGFIKIIPGYPLKYELIDKWENYNTDNFELLKRYKTPTLFDKPRTKKQKRQLYLRFKKTEKSNLPIDININGKSNPIDININGGK